MPFRASCLCDLLVDLGPHLAGCGRRRTNRSSPLYGHQPSHGNPTLPSLDEILGIRLSLWDDCLENEPPERPSRRGGRRDPIPQNSSSFSLLGSIPSKIRSVGSMPVLDPRLFPDL